MNTIKIYKLFSKDRTTAFEEIRRKFTEEFKVNPWLYQFEVLPIGTEKKD